jgi:hypothetical protein
VGNALAVTALQDRRTRKRKRFRGVSAFNQCKRTTCARSPACILARMDGAGAARSRRAGEAGALDP